MTMPDPTQPEQPRREFKNYSVIEIQSRIKGEYEKMVITSEQAHSLTLTE
jgi:hypothetical protein